MTDWGAFLRGLWRGYASIGHRTLWLLGTGQPSVASGQWVVLSPPGKFWLIVLPNSERCPPQRQGGS